MLETNRRNFLKILGITGAIGVIPNAMLPEIGKELEISALEIPEPETVRTSLQFIWNKHVYNLGDALQLTMINNNLPRIFSNIPGPKRSPSIAIDAYGDTTAYRNAHDIINTQVSERLPFDQSLGKLVAQMYASKGHFFEYTIDKVFMRDLNYQFTLDTDMFDMKLQFDCVEFEPLVTTRVLNG